jgi:hypothetical protein
MHDKRSCFPAGRVLRLSDQLGSKPLISLPRGSKGYFDSSAAFSESVLSGPSSASAVPSAAVPAATTAAVAALFATLLTRVFAFEEGRTADLARANFVLAFAATFLIFDLTGARFEDVLDLPRLTALFIVFLQLCVSRE